MFYTENLSILLILLFFAGYRALRWIPEWNNEKSKNLFIATGSVIFYGLWYPPAIGLLLFHGLFVLLLSPSIQKKSRAALSAAIGLALALLFTFKYFNFFMVEITGVFHTTTQILLPLGISFYTFTIIGYYVDLYKGEVEPITKWSQALLLLAFWPHLASGPILRASRFLGNARHHIPLSSDTITLAVVMITTGVVKKLLLADNIASYVDWNISFGITDMTPLESWTTILGFAAQIYFDFSGYTDIAIGLALLLGFRLPANFNYPYAAHSLSEFWRRWHISLSQWFRDYLYIPLGGNKNPFPVVCLCLLTVFAISGVWHGAGYGFLAWGLTHGIYLVTEKILSRYKLRLPHKAQGVVTFTLVTLAWPFFRLDFQNALLILRKMLLVDGFGTFTMTSQFYVLPILLLCFGLVIDHVMKFYEVNNEGYPVLKTQSRSVYFALGLFLLLAFMFSGKEQEFIYFQF